jgi:hypothetical protein
MLGRISRFSFGIYMSHSRKECQLKWAHLCENKKKSPGLSCDQMTLSFLFGSVILFSKINMHTATYCVKTLKSIQMVAAID